MRRLPLLLIRPLSMLFPFALSVSKGAAGSGLRQAQPERLSVAQPERLSVTLRAGLIACCLWASCLPVFASALEPLVFGVFANRSHQESEQRWGELAAYLGRALPGYEVRLLPLDAAEMEDALRRNQLDLLLTNPSHYVVLRQSYPLSGVIATLVEEENGTPTPVLGGVIFTRAERTELRTLAHLKGRRMAALAERYLGGRAAPAFELMRAGIDPKRDLTLVVKPFQDEVVEAVLAGEVDAGMVRTGIIERMMAEGRLSPEQIRVLNEQHLPGYPFRVSTRLYPEWPVVVLPHVHPTTVGRLAAELLSLAPDSAAARAADIHGFTLPADYLPVEELMRTLRIAPFDVVPPISFDDLWARHALVISLLGGGATALLGALFLLLANRQRLLESQHRLRISEQGLRLAASVFATANEGVLVTDRAGSIIEVNDAFTFITGYERDEVLGKNPRVLSSGRHDEAFFSRMWRCINETGRWRGEIWNRRKNGEVYPEHLSISAVQGDDGKVSHYVAVLADISHLKAHEQELKRLAHYDPLTGLPNRRLLSDRIAQAMTHTRRRGDIMALVVLDLDGFKPINDSLGHEAGDRVLKGVAQRLKRCLRGGDTAARLGGDEFVLVLLGIDSLRECELAFERILTELARPLDLDGSGSVVVSASLGATLYPDDHSDADTLLRHADQAMYRAKQEGRNRFHVFDAEHDRGVQELRVELERLSHAQANREFVLYYQPKVDMRDGEVLGMEALVRWQHPSRGLLPPAEFLPLLEGTPLELEFGRWVIDTALARLQAWQADGLDLSMSINLAVRHLLQPDFPQQLAQALAAYPDISPADVELEVLESAAVEDWELAGRILGECRTLGVSFALDDFGTGYSSLLQLRRLAAQTLKIDQHFVRDMLEDPDDLLIVESVIRLSESFQRRVVAEGVETEEHARALVALGCHEGQGYGIARPMPPEAVMDWIRDWRDQGFWRRP